MKFHPRKTFGPRISLTERQMKKIEGHFQRAGLTCFIEECPTGSVYILVGLPAWDRNIRGEWYNDLECGCSDDIAKIRLSGHVEGRRQDATHNVVGTKRECLAALERWTKEIIETHSEQGKAILRSTPGEKEHEDATMVN